MRHGRSESAREQRIALYQANNNNNSRGAYCFCSQYSNDRLLDRSDIMLL